MSRAFFLGKGWPWERPKQ